MRTPDCVQDLSAVERRIKDTAEWLKKNGGNFSSEQKHLDEGSQERIYWHYGYLVALKDMMRFLTGEAPPSRKSYKPDSSNSFPST
jgi:hypothetical protein